MGLPARNRDPQMFDQRLKILFLCALVAGVFILDTETSYDVAASGCYSVTVLFGVSLFRARGVMILACICAGLTALSAILTHSHEHGVALVNMLISVLALATATFLALRIVAVEAEARDAQAHVGRLTRMNSLGALTASIAHEINQPLTAILASGNAGVRWLAQAPPRMDRAQANFDRIVTEAGRAGDIIDRLRRLARGDPPSKTLIDLNAAIQEAAGLVKADYDRSGASLEFRLPAAAPVVLADPVQIQQVLHNLLSNALEAGDGHSKRRKHRVTLSCETVADEAVVTVADLGVGLPSDATEKVFDAFWTTKGSGIGMGLTICRSIVENHGGTMSIAANRPRGARVMFSLPASTRTA